MHLSLQDCRSSVLQSILHITVLFSKNTVATAYFHLYAGDSDKIIILKYVSKTEECILECDWTKTNSYSVECHVHTVSLKDLEISVEILTCSMYFTLFYYF